MVEVEFSGTDAFEKRLGDMLGHLRHFKAVDLGHVLSDWQTEDLHRKKPFTMRFRGAGKASTRVRPHSRYEVMHSRRYQRSLRRHALVPTRISTRPILRAELYPELWDRFTKAVAEKLHW